MHSRLLFSLISENLIFFVKKSERKCSWLEIGSTKFLNFVPKTSNVTYKKILVRLWQIDPHQVFLVVSKYPNPNDRPCMYVYFLAGEIVNLISVDSQKIEDACLMINLMWSCPLQVGLAIYFLYQTIGVSVFVGKTMYSSLTGVHTYMRNKVHYCNTPRYTLDFAQKTWHYSN